MKLIVYNLYTLLTQYKIDFMSLKEKKIVRFRDKKSNANLVV